MNPTFTQGYDNFDTVIRDACGYRKPYCVIGGEIKKTPIDNFYVAENKTEEFDNVAGKGKICKGAGLTGAEKIACKKNIKVKCKHKPLFGKGKKDAWEKCAAGTIITPEQYAKETAEKLVPSTPDTGITIEAKIVIGVTIIGTIALIGLAVVRAKRKSAPQPLV